MKYAWKLICSFGIIIFFTMATYFLFTSYEANNMRGTNDNFGNRAVKTEVYVHVPVKTQFDSYQCKDKICSEFLSKSEKSIVNNICKSKKDVPIPTKCHFMNGTNRTPVALVSLPGSGNTWVRGLLEKATGICTGECSC